MDKITRRSALALAGGAAASTEALAKGAAQLGTGKTERVLGIGGFFFRAKDPKAISKWYEENLGVTLPPSNYDSPPWRTEEGITIFSPFEQSTTVFGERQQWMINFRVRDLEKMTAQLRRNGIIVEVEPVIYPNGRFAKIVDPEGNPIQLWELGGKAKKSRGR